MDELIYKFDNYSLWRISHNSIYNAIEFIVKTNYMSHNGVCPLNIFREIDVLYGKEKEYDGESFFYVVKDNHNKIIGTIRALCWEGKTELPIQTIFNVDINKLKKSEYGIEHIWHIGCFAIDTSCLGKLNISILKMLLAQAVFHVCNGNSLMLAECDRKLFEKIKLLNICSCEAGESKHYLGSETVPVYNTSNKLKQFLWKQREHLYINGIESIFPKKNNERSKIIELCSEEQAWAV